MNAHEVFIFNEGKLFLCYVVESSGEGVEIKMTKYGLKAMQY